MERESLEVTRMNGARGAFGDERGQDFRSAAEAAPFALRSLGLGNGIATLAAKEGESRVFAALIARWLLTECRHSPFVSTQTPDAVAEAEKAAENERDDKKTRALIDAAWVRALLDRIGTGNRRDYRIAQIESIEFAAWLKRLAQAFIAKG